MPDALSLHIHKPTNLADVEQIVDIVFKYDGLEFTGNCRRDDGLGGTSDE